MSSSITIETKLKDFGLSDNEAKVYLSLLKSDKASIQNISKYNNIPRSTVYEILKALLNKGLIQEVIEDNKKEYKPYSLDILKHHFIEEQKKLEERIESLSSMENVIGNISAQSLNNFEVRKYSGKSGARQLFWNTLDTKDIVCVYSYFGRSKYVGEEFYDSFVRESKIRNIKERVIINPSERVFDIINRHINTPHARTKPEDIKSLSTDQIDIQGETFIYNNIFATVFLDKEEIVGFEVENKDFVNTQRSIFNTHWNLAKSLTFQIS